MNDKRQKLWKDFIVKYKKHFKSFDEIWSEKLIELQIFLEKYKRRPKALEKAEIQLCQWLEQNIGRYRINNEFKNHIERTKKWELFLEKNKEYFNSLDEVWEENFKKVKEFIIKNEQRPNKRIENEKYLGSWLTNQVKNYKNNINSFYDNPERRKQWEQFLVNYKEYFKSFDDVWNEHNFSKKFIYTFSHLKRPFNHGHLFQCYLSLIFFLFQQLTY